MFYGIIDEGFGSSFEGFSGNKVEKTQNKKNSPLLQKAKEMKDADKIDHDNVDRPIAKDVDVREAVYYLNESYQDSGTMDGNFNGKKFTVKIKTDNPDSKLMSKVQSVIKTIGSVSLYNYLYESDKNFYRDEINNDPYFDGKKIESGKDLMDSIEINHKNTTIFVDDRRNTIYFCGEYWVDPEHGFSITFPGGKFVKANKTFFGELQMGKNKKKYDSNYNPIVTFMGLYSDAL